VIAKSFVNVQGGQGGHTQSGLNYNVSVLFRLFRYTFNGRQYNSSRYQIFGNSPSSQAGCQAVVDSIPPGSTTVCRINPDDPAHAILDPGFGALSVLFVLAPIFAVIGGGVIYITRSRYPRLIRK